MADEFDVDAMLEAAYVSKSSADHSSRENGISSYSNGSNHSKDPKEEEPKRDRDRRRSRSRDRERKSRNRSRSGGRKERSKSMEKKRRSRSRERDRERVDRVERKRSRSRSKDKHRRRRSRSKSKEKQRRSGSGSTTDRRRSRTPPRLRLGPRRRSSRTPTKEDAPLTAEERDARTVFCMQLSQRVRARDLEDFFSSVGKVRDVRMITCNKTRRFKGIAYVEFGEIESVALALGLNGQKLMGIPIIVQPSQAEKNRAGQVAKAGALPPMATSNPGPMKLYVGSLHFNITEDMLRGIFEPFGRVDEIILMKDHDTGRSKGFGFITFHEGEDAKRAMEQLNGFEIAGRPMKVGYVTEKSENNYHNPQNYLDTDEMDRAGVNLGVTGRLQLMAKLAEGTDLKLPEAAATALNMQTHLNQSNAGASATAQATATPTTAAAPAIATQCFMLSNMFDPLKETENPSFELELKEEVIEACLEHGGAVHVFVDTKSPQGNVYVKCPAVSNAVAAVNSLHGRWFGGRLITAAYVPFLNYHNLFPDAVAAQSVLRSSKKS